MEVNINGEPTTLPTELSIHQLLIQKGFEEKRLAVEVNLEIVPRSTFSTHKINPGDRIEIVHAIGGG